MPALECKTESGAWETCNKEVVCSLEDPQVDEDYRYYWEDSETFENLITHNHWVCLDDVEIGFIGSMSFMGSVISSLTIMRLFDVLGRKWFTMVTLALNAIVI